MSHTPEPWSINDWPQANTDISIGAIGTPLIARIPLRDVSINEQKANARRIVACVNACSGVATEFLENNARVVVLGPPIADRFTELERQRDELLSAARYAKEVIGILWVSHQASRADAAIEQLDAAIAKAEAAHA